MNPGASQPVSLVHHSPDGDQVIPLEPGTYRVGSHPDSALILDHPSVSEAHCEIEVGEGRVVVRDLSSVTGTLIDGLPVQEDVLRPGQVLRIGEVEFSYPRPNMSGKGAVRVGSGPSGVGTASPPAAMAGTVPPAAAMPRMARPRRAKAQALSPDAGIAGQMKDAFGYPMRQNGLVLLACGTIVFSLLKFAQMLLTSLPTVGILSLALWITFVMSGGYLFAFMQDVITTSARGDAEMPSWPEISDFLDGVVKPFFRLLVICGLCVGPGMVLLTVSLWVGMGVLVLGLSCLPMAFLTVAMADGFGGLNPLIIFSGIAKVPGQYLCICLVFLAALAVQRAGDFLLDYSPIPLLPTVIGTFIFLYGLTVEMRLLGLLYYCNRERLAWFP